MEVRQTTRTRSSIGWRSGNTKFPPRPCCAISATDLVKKRHFVDIVVKHFAAFQEIVAR